MVFTELGALKTAHTRKQVNNIVFYKTILYSCYMFVLTIDQRKSTTQGDRVPQLLELLTTHPQAPTPLRAFERTAGDEVQAVFNNPQDLLNAALMIARTQQWHIGIGSGTIKEPLPTHAREGNGEAYKNARQAVERAKKSAGNVAYQAPADDPYQLLIEATLQLVFDLEEKRSEQRQLIGNEYTQGKTQQEIATELGISQQAVSSALALGRWRETRTIMHELAQLLQQHSNPQNIEANR